MTKYQSLSWPSEVENIILILNVLFSSTRANNRLYQELCPGIILIVISCRYKIVFIIQYLKSQRLYKTGN